jgi:hypothetical protein
MDAPLYPPAERYEQPRLAQREFGVDFISLGDLIRSPEARAILDQEVPGLTALARAPQLAWTVSNVTLREAATFSFAVSMFKPGALDRVDARLRTLLPSAWPGL